MKKNFKLCNFTSTAHKGAKGEGGMASHWQTIGLYWILRRNPSPEKMRLPLDSWKVQGQDGMGLERPGIMEDVPAHGSNMDEPSGSFQPKQFWDSVNQRLQEDLPSIRFHLSSERKFQRSWVFLKLWMMGLFKLCPSAKNFTVPPEPDICT